NTSGSCLDHLGDRVLDQPLKARDAFAAQHHGGERLALRHVLEQANEGGRWRVQREGAGGACSACAKRAYLSSSCVLEGGAMDHRVPTEGGDGDLREAARRQRRQPPPPRQLARAPAARFLLLNRRVHRPPPATCRLSYSVADTGS